MSLFDFFSRKQSAPVARERLQIMLAHDRALSSNRDLAAILQEEILAVIARHIPIEREKVLVKLDRGKAVSTLEIDIEMPGAADAMIGKLDDKPDDKLSDKLSKTLGETQDSVKTKAVSG